MRDIVEGCKVDFDWVKVQKKSETAEESINLLQK